MDKATLPVELCEAYASYHHGDLTGIKSFQHPDIAGLVAIVHPIHGLDFWLQAGPAWQFVGNEETGAGSYNSMLDILDWHPAVPIQVDKTSGWYYIELFGGKYYRKCSHWLPDTEVVPYSNYANPTSDVVLTFPRGTDCNSTHYHGPEEWELGDRGIEKTPFWHSRLGNWQYKATVELVEKLIAEVGPSMDQYATLQWDKVHPKNKVAIEEWLQEHADKMNTFFDGDSEERKLKYKHPAPWFFINLMYGTWELADIKPLTVYPVALTGELAD